MTIVKSIYQEVIVQEARQLRLEYCLHVLLKEGRIINVGWMTA